MNTVLQARILDMHTVLLGKNKRWIRLSLPWLARDIATLIQSSQKDAKDKETLDPLNRLPALRMVLMQLEVTTETEIEVEMEEEWYRFGNSSCSLSYHSQAKIIHVGEPIPVNGNICYVCDPLSLLEFETLFIHRHPNALLSLLVYTDQALMIGPILPTKAYCPVCFAYLASIQLGLPTTDPQQEKIFLQTGLALARSTTRKLNESVFFDGKMLELKPFTPFIGCPHCFPSEGHSLC